MKELFILTSGGLSRESGYCVTYSTSGCAQTLPYSHKHKMFNVRDSYDDDTVSRYNIDVIGAIVKTLRIILD